MRKTARFAQASPVLPAHQRDLSTADHAVCRTAGLYLDGCGIGNPLSGVWGLGYSSSFSSIATGHSRPDIDLPHSLRTHSGFRFRSPAKSRSLLVTGPRLNLATTGH